jgi:hypothetical protein
VKDAKGVEQTFPARIEPYKAQKTEPPLPKISAPHVFDWLMEVGPAEASGMGQVPVSWREIDAWSARTFQRPSAWEARLLRRLSAEYLAELHAAENLYRPAPWSPVPTRIDRDANERQLRAVLG